MEQTRKLAIDFKQKTGQPLAVSSELARFDVHKLFHFTFLPEEKTGIDLIGCGPFDQMRIQVKSRVMFNAYKGNLRIGQLNTQSDWDVVFLVVYDESYQPMEIHAAHRDQLLSQVNEQSKKGSMSIAKFKALGQLVWSPEHGFEPIDDGFNAGSQE